MDAIPRIGKGRGEGDGKRATSSSSSSRSGGQRPITSCSVSLRARKITYNTILLSQYCYAKYPVFFRYFLTDHVNVAGSCPRFRENLRRIKTAAQIASAVFKTREQNKSSSCFLSSSSKPGGWFVVERSSAPAVLRTQHVGHTFGPPPPPPPVAAE